jgi:predicted nucleotidyltransferase
VHKIIIDDVEVNEFVSAAKKLFGKNLVAIILYGSRYWGFADDSSDYDLFIFVNKKNMKAEKNEQILSKKSPKFHIRYFIELNKNNLNRKRNSWASYVVLTRFSFPLYQTATYKKFIAELKKMKPNVAEVVKKLVRENNEYEIGELKKKRGFKANEWAFFSIWKRLQIINFYKTKRIQTDLNTNIKACSELLTKDQILLIRKVYKRTFKRNEKWSSTDKVESIKVLKKLSSRIENIS